MPEPMPVKDFMDELDSQWVANNVAKPQLIEVTGETNDPLRFNLNVNDVVFGRPGEPAQEEIPRKIHHSHTGSKEIVFLSALSFLLKAATAPYVHT